MSRKMLLTSPFKSIRVGRASAGSQSYTVLMEAKKDVGRYSSIDCDFIFYPYASKLNSSNITIEPFEEYVEDILQGQRSVYFPITHSRNKIFGILLGLFITFFFAFTRFSELTSVQSIAAIVGFYLVGKEMWTDLENFLLTWTRKWRLRYYPEQYSYQLETDTTLTNYTKFARKRRYFKPTIMPSKIDLVKQRNAYTARMFLNNSDLQVFQQSEQVRLMIFTGDQNAQTELEKHNGLLGIKVSLNLTLLGFTRSWELFQSLDKGKFGALDDHGNWRTGAVFYRQTWSWGRLKFYKSSGLIESHQILFWE